MSERELIEEYKKLLLECVDGDNPDNFARKVTKQDILDTYDKIFELGGEF